MTTDTKRMIYLAGIVVVVVAISAVGFDWFGMGFDWFGTTPAK